MAEPTNADLMKTLREMHGDIRVALERTEVQARESQNIWTGLNKVTSEQAALKGQATIVGALASALLVGVIEAAKMIFGSGHH